MASKATIIRKSYPTPVAPVLLSQPHSVLLASNTMLKPESGKKTTILISAKRQRNTAVWVTWEYLTLVRVTHLCGSASINWERRI